MCASGTTSRPPRSPAPWTASRPRSAMSRPRRSASTSSRRSAGARRPNNLHAVRVAVVAEYYPRAANPVLGVWAHRQALAARDAGADVRVLVLHRPVRSRAALKEFDPARLVEPLRQPLRAELDGIE